MSNAHSLSMLIIGFRHHILFLKNGEDLGRLCDNEKMLKFFDDAVDTCLINITTLGGLLSALGEKEAEGDIKSHLLQNLGDLIEDLTCVSMLCREFGDQDSKFSKAEPYGIRKLKVVKKKNPKP